MIRATARSAATPARLWSLASDVERWGDRLSTVDSVRPLGNGLTGVGSRFEVRQGGSSDVCAVLHLPGGVLSRV